MDISAFLFANKIPAHTDPLWFMAGVILVAIFFILVGTYGARFFKKESHQALHKTLKKSGGWLKAFGIILLILFWFRLESLRILSIKLWWILLGLLFVFIAFRKIRYYLDLQRRIHAGKKIRGEE